MKQVVCSKFAGPGACDHMVEAESPEEAMELLKPHYMEAHADIMKQGTEADRKMWYQKFTQAWEMTPDM